MLVAQLGPTLCNPMYYIVPGILQAGIQEWVAVPFSRGIFPTQGSNPGFPPCRQIFTVWAAREALGHVYFITIFFQYLFIYFIFGRAGSSLPPLGCLCTGLL